MVKMVYILGDFSGTFYDTPLNSIFHQKIDKSSGYHEGFSELSPHLPCVFHHDDDGIVEGVELVSGVPLSLYHA